MLQFGAPSIQMQLQTPSSSHLFAPHDHPIDALDKKAIIMHDAAVTITVTIIKSSTNFYKPCSTNKTCAKLVYDRDPRVYTSLNRSKTWSRIKMKNIFQLFYKFAYMTTTWTRTSDLRLVADRGKWKWLETWCGPCLSSSGDLLGRVKAKVWKLFQSQLHILEGTERLARCRACHECVNQRQFNHFSTAVLCSLDTSFLFR